MPSIEVKNLKKYYPGHKALNGVSFSIEPGEIVGYLGPNGSGKTTTLRILSCFMPATSGSAWMGGFDVQTESLQARQILGYLPEHVPLYGEMRVCEYLKFRAELKGVARCDRKERIKEVVDACLLGDVYTKIISQLSKGYKQRVGLADAMVHQPDILILDEPTVGLDPVQLKQIRSIIKAYGKDHTVMLSTHILQEVEILCDRVFIINKGELLAEGTPAQLREAYRIRDVYHVLNPTDQPHVLESIRCIDGVCSAHKITVAGMDKDYREYRIETDRGFDFPAELNRLFRAKDWSFTELRRAHISLEDVFVGLIYNQFADNEKQEFAALTDLSDLQTISQSELARMQRTMDEIDG